MANLNNNTNELQDILDLLDGKASSGGQFGNVEYDESTQTLIIND